MQFCWIDILPLPVCFGLYDYPTRQFRSSRITSFHRCAPFRLRQLSKPNSSRNLCVVTHWFTWRKPSRTGLRRARRSRLLPESACLDPAPCCQPRHTQGQWERTEEEPILDSFALNVYYVEYGPYLLRQRGQMEGLLQKQCTWSNLFQWNCSIRIP